MATIKDLLVAKLKELDLSATAAAEKFGLSAPGVRAVAAGKSLPNARSLAKYADLLGVPAEELKAQAAAARGGDAKPAKAKKGGKARAGRKSMKKGARAAAKPAKGRGKIRVAKAKGGAAAAIKAIEAALAESAALAGDDLAKKVHGLSKKGRAVIAGLIGSLS